MLWAGAENGLAKSPEEGVPWVMVKPKSTAVHSQDRGKAHSSKLSQTFPNPFNSATTILFTLSQSKEIDLSVYSLASQEVVPALLHESNQDKKLNRSGWRPVR